MWNIGGFPKVYPTYMSLLYLVLIPFGTKIRVTPNPLKPAENAGFKYIRQNTKIWQNVKKCDKQSKNQRNKNIRKKSWDQ